MCKRFLIVVLLMLPLLGGYSAGAQSCGIITRVAGNSSAGFIGDGGPATDAELFRPTAVVVDPAGNIYISDGSNQRIRKVTASGTISTFAGNGTAGYSGDGGQATAAEINGPLGLAIDRTGNLYIADFNANVIRKVTPAGIISTFAGNSTSGFSGDGGPATAAQLKNPWSVAIDAAGSVYVTDNGNNRIRKITADGIINTFAGNGTAGFAGDGGAATAAEFSGIAGVAIDASGSLYVADASNNRIRKVAPFGTVNTIAGNGTAAATGDGGAATLAGINGPTGVAVDGGGNVYLTDISGSKVRRINPSGIITKFAGTGTGGATGDGGAATAAELFQPEYVVVDGNDNVFIADRGANEIRKVGTCNTAIPELQSTIFPDIEIYPNPCTGTLSVVLPGSISDATITVTDLAGRTLKTETASDRKVDLDLSGYAPGLYLLKVVCKDKTFFKNVVLSR